MTRERLTGSSAAAPQDRPGLPEPMLDAELSLRVDGRNVGGARRLALLAEIGRAGSITEAARRVGLSYKGAWDAIEQMSILAGAALVERSTGGRGGGRASLTPRGVELVQRYALAEAEHARFVQRLNRRAGALPSAPPALLTSARNQLAGTVCAVRQGSINDEIELALVGGQHIVATVTRESRLELGLAEGVPAFALVKASALSLVRTSAGAEPRAADPPRNRLAGTVRRIATGAGDTEVALDLPGGASLAAVIPARCAVELELHPGCSALALFEAGSVIVGVLG